MGSGFSPFSRIFRSRWGILLDWNPAFKGVFARTDATVLLLWGSIVRPYKILEVDISISIENRSLGIIMFSS